MRWRWYRAFFVRPFDAWGMALTVEYGVLDDAQDDPDAMTAVVDAFQSLFATYDWWADRDDEEVRAALEATDEVVFVRDDSAAAGEGSRAATSGSEAGEVVAAARVLTDYVYYAQVYDVIVTADRRGAGVGRTLVEGIVDHPALADVAPSLLAREGLVSFYEICGFEDPGGIEHPDGDPEPLTWLVARRDADETEETA
jgi:GNAT superfamily N-acetyltransferase